MWLCCSRSEEFRGKFRRKPRRKPGRKVSEAKLFASRIGGGDQGAENGTRCFMVLHRARGGPFHREHEMIRRTSFQSFNDAIVGTAGGDAEAVADHVGGLVMRRVHGQNQPAAFR